MREREGSLVPEEVARGPGGPGPEKLAPRRGEAVRGGASEHRA